jgi:heat shock protein HtpX
MKRRPLGRDLGLTIRMAVALIPIVVWYLVAFLLLIVLVVGTLVDRQWSAFLGAVLFAVGGPVLLWEHIHRSETVALRAARAKELGEDDDPDLQALVARVAAMADLRPPRVARSWAPNAFSVGLNERSRASCFVVTSPRPSSRRLSRTSWHMWPPAMGSS